MASQITSLTIVCSTVCSDAYQRDIKAPRHCPLCGEFTGDRWIPCTKASNAEMFPFDDAVMDIIIHDIRHFPTAIYPMK